MKKGLIHLYLERLNQNQRDGKYNESETTCVNIIKVCLAHRFFNGDMEAYLKVAEKMDRKMVEVFWKEIDGYSEETVAETMIEIIKEVPCA